MANLLNFRFSDRLRWSRASSLVFARLQKIALLPEITGDGVIGLSRSLISAGVPSVIVSLWSVPDAPTSELMKEFYQNLQHNPDKAQALRQAMLSTIKQYPSPRDWAAFTLIGESQ